MAPCHFTLLHRCVNPSPVLIAAQLLEKAGFPLALLPTKNFHSAGPPCFAPPKRFTQAVREKVGRDQTTERPRMTATLRREALACLPLPFAVGSLTPRSIRSSRTCATSLRVPLNGGSGAHSPRRGAGAAPCCRCGRSRRCRPFPAVIALIFVLLSACRSRSFAVVVRCWVINSVNGTVTANLRYVTPCASEWGFGGSQPPAGCRGGAPAAVQSR